MWETRYAYKILVGNSVQKFLFGDREQNRTTLILISGRQVVRIEVDVTDSELYPVASSGISCLGPSGSTTILLRYTP
jgi:phosphatidylserine decarboxylase